MLPDLATFKRTLKVATQNNKLGIAERSKCKKMLEQLYGMSDSFFKEIDLSIKRNCKTVNDVRTYLFAFQGFNNDLLKKMEAYYEKNKNNPAKRTNFMANLEAMQKELERRNEELKKNNK